MKSGCRVGYVLVVALTFSCPAAPHAAGLDQYAGWEGDDRRQGFGYTGLGVALPASRTLELPVALSVSYLYYHYDSAGTSISVRSPGASLMSGLRIHGAHGSASLTGGVETRWEHRDIGVAATRQITWGAVVQSYGDLAFGRRLQASEFAVYVGSASYVVARAALRYQLSNLDWKGPVTTFAGIESVRQGNADSDAFQWGGFAEWNVVPQRVSLGLHAGLKTSWTPGQPHQAGSYIGTSLYHHF
jgi:hypothetical protein